MKKILFLAGGILALGLSDAFCQDAIGGGSFKCPESLKHSDVAKLIDGKTLTIDGQSFTLFGDAGAVKKWFPTSKLNPMTLVGFKFAGQSVSADGTEVSCGYKLNHDPLNKGSIVSMVPVK